MSFVEQERVLFDLLFDSQLRERFCQRKADALFDYDLSEEEQSDFNVIRTSALNLDADMRSSMALSWISQYYPLSFGLVSTLPSGTDHLRTLISPKLMRLKQFSRLVHFGEILKLSLAHYQFDNDFIGNVFLNIIECEHSMAKTHNACLEHFQHKNQREVLHAVPDNWLEQPVSLSSFLSAHVLPLPYEKLIRLLSPFENNYVWRTIIKKPLSKSVLNDIIEQQDHSLFVAKAVLESESQCDPKAIHKTMTLNAGFGNLLQNANGTTSVKEILLAMETAGADAKLLQSIQSGFYELIKNNMCSVI